MRTRGLQHPKPGAGRPDPLTRRSAGELCGLIGCLAVLLAGSGGVAILSGQELPAATSNKAMPPQTKATRAPAYPRLFFTSAQITRLKQRIETNSVIREAWETLLQRADRLVNEELAPLAEAESGRGQHGNYGRPSSQIAQMGATLGLAYQVTGHSNYAVKLREAMLHFAGLQRWAGDAGWDPPWHSELNTARFCFGYAVGFDSIHDFLNPEDRQTIASAIVQRGARPTLEDWLLPEKRIHALDSMGHNWWSVCVAMGGLAALSVLDEEPAAAGWARRVADSFPEWFAYQGNLLQNKSPNFDAQGAFYESVGYANYALSEYLLFRLAYGNTFPDSSPPEIPLLKTAGDFFLNTCYPTAEGLLSVNFGDSSLKANGARTVRMLLANGIQSEAYHWYLNRTDPGLDDPLGLVYQELNPEIQSPGNLPASQLYPDIGWAMLRSSWTNNATLLAVKSGFTWNHAHPDAASFILFHNGKPLIIDSGNCSYSRREYTSYYRQSRAHNVITLDGEAQNPEDCARGDRGVAIPGSVHHLLDAAGIKYVLADATGPTAWKFSRNYRHALWLDGVILIIDDIRAHEAGQLEWLLHYEGTARQEEGRLHLANGESCQAMVLPLFPESMDIVEKKGLLDHEPDIQVPYLAFTPNEPLREAKFITAILPQSSDPDQPSPTLERWRGEEVLGARIRSAKTITEVYLNLRADGRKMHRNSCHVIEGWETDAYLFAVTRPVNADPNDVNSFERIVVACGSYLRRNGQSFIDSLSKVYLAYTPGQDKVDMALSGQSRLRVNVRNPIRPTEVRVNGRPKGFDYHKNTASLEVRLGFQ